MVSQRPYAYLLVNILPQVDAVLVTNLDVADMQSVDEILDGFRCASRRGSQRQQAEVRVLRHHVAHNLVVCVVAGSSVGLVCATVNLKTLCI